MSSEKFFMFSHRAPSSSMCQSARRYKAGHRRSASNDISTFLAYSFILLPSNYLFIAYGLTSFPIAFLALPFFCRTPGELHAFWIRTASAVGDRLELDWFESAPYFVAYLIISQLLLIPIIYGFTRVDWHAVFAGERSSGSSSQAKHLTCRVGACIGFEFGLARGRSLSSAPHECPVNALSS